MSQPTPPLIYKKVSEAMKEIDAIAKSRKNQAQGFNFRGIDDIYNEMHPHLAKHGLFTVPEVLEQTREERQTKSGGVSTHVIMKIKFTMFAEDGSSISATMIGEGADTGDKASNKAQAIAHKYFFLQVFAIPTEDAKDPDGESTEFAPKGQAKPAAAQANQKPSAPAKGQKQVQNKATGEMVTVGAIFDTPADLAQWIIPAGVYAKRKLGEIPTEELVQYLGKMDEGAQNGGNLNKQAQEILKNGRAFLAKKTAPAAVVQ